MLIHITVFDNINFILSWNNKKVIDMNTYVDFHARCCRSVRDCLLMVKIQGFLVLLNIVNIHYFSLLYIFIGRIRQDIFYERIV